MYKSIKAKEAIHKLYFQKLNSLEIDYDKLSVDTHFGQTNIIVTGNPDAPPLVLIHGANGCAPVALSVYPKLSEKYKVYSVDVIGEPNLSADIKMSKKDYSYGLWLKEVLICLNLNDVVLAGFSLGGLVIWQTLVVDESRIKKAFLAAPAGIVNGNPLKSIFQILIPMKSYIRNQQKKHLEQLVSALFTDNDLFAKEFLGTVIPNFKMDFSPIKLIPQSDAQSIETPITIFGADQDIMFPGKKLIKRAQKIFPSLQEAILLKNSKHVQSESDNELIQKHMLI